MIGIAVGARKTEFLVRHRLGVRLDKIATLPNEAVEGLRRRRIVYGLTMPRNDIDRADVEIRGIEAIVAGGHKVAIVTGSSRCSVPVIVLRRSSTNLPLSCSRQWRAGP